MQNQGWHHLILVIFVIYYTSSFSFVCFKFVHKCSRVARGGCGNFLGAALLVCWINIFLTFIFFNNLFIIFWNWTFPILVNCPTALLISIIHFLRFITPFQVYRLSKLIRTSISTELPTTSYPNNFKKYLFMNLILTITLLSTVLFLPYLPTT